MCDQQSLRSACAYAQSDQSLCLSLEYYMIVKLLTEHHLEFLSLTGGCRGSSESTHVKVPHCWKSHVMAQIIVESLHGKTVRLSDSKCPECLVNLISVFTFAYFLPTSCFYVIVIPWVVHLYVEIIHEL